jgi:Fe2+ transport system protein FeoA
MTDQAAPHSGKHDGNSPSLPLTLLEPGRHAVIVDIAGPGHGIRARLSDMGLIRGVNVRVMPGPGAGALVVERDGCRIAIGRGMGHRIMVMPLDAHRD